LRRPPRQRLKASTRRSARDQHQDRHRSGSGRASDGCRTRHLLHRHRYSRHRRKWHQRKWLRSHRRQRRHSRRQPLPSGSYGVQIASLPSEAEAKKSYASLSKKFAGVLSGRSYEIRKADIAGKGTFYRVRIPASSKDEAAAICEKYRSAGGSCLISK
jgi:hypothetical protein